MRSLLAIISEYTISQNIICESSCSTDIILVHSEDPGQTQTPADLAPQGQVPEYDQRKLIAGRSRYLCAVHRRDQGIVIIPHGCFTHLSGFSSRGQR